MSSTGESKSSVSHLADLKTFKEFQISRSGLSGLHIEGKDAKHAQFYVETSLMLPTKKDVTIHAGHDSKGKIVADVDLKNFSGHYTIGLGDPNDANSYVTEELDRVKGWATKHEFEFTFGGRESQIFLWRHRGENLSENRDDLELVAEDEDREEEDELLAVYEGKGGDHGWKAKGRLLMKGGGGEQWELMVVATLTSLIVSRRREQ